MGTTPQMKEGCEHSVCGASVGRFPRPRAQAAFWLLVLLLVLAEGAARLWGPAMPSCAADRRNAYRYRGWPEYVEGVRDLLASNRTAVVISNCQGYGAELPGKMGYPAVLQTELNRVAGTDGLPWRVVNWSLDGATSIEYTVLAAYLRTIRPEVVIASVAFADFRAEHARAGYRYCRSDVARLATRPAVLRPLPISFLRRHAKVEDSLAMWAFDRSALLRAAEYAWSWLDGHMPGCHYAMYAPAMNYRPWRIEGERQWLPEIRPIGVPRDQDLDLAYDDRSTTMVKELAAVLAAGNAPVVLVAQPFRDSHSSMPRFLEDLAGAAAEQGIPFWDLHDVLPSGEFVTSNHLSRRGHRALAEELARRMDAEFRMGEGN